jgi:hypothetical protein
MTWSDRAMNLRFSFRALDARLLADAGHPFVEASRAYPDLPEVALCQRMGKVSVRPRNRRRKSSTRALGERSGDSTDLLDVGTPLGVAFTAAALDVPSSCACRREFSPRSRASSAWRARTSTGSDGQTPADQTSSTADSRLRNLIFSSIICQSSNFIDIYIRCKLSRSWANRWPPVGATWP